MQKRNRSIAKILLVFATLLPLLLLVNFSFAQKVSKKVLNIPYFTQENGPDCWAASLLMITNAVNPKTDSNIIKVIRSVNEPDGISVRSMEEHQAFNSEISKLTGVNPNITTYWSGTNTQSTIASDIKSRLDNDQPVMICSTQSINGTVGGHCVVIVGYSGDDYFYIHDPRGTSGQVKLGVPYSKVFSSNASYALVSVPKAVSPGRHLLTARMVNKAIVLIKPKAAGKSGGTTSIDFVVDRNNPEGYSFANNPLSSGNIPDGYNILSLEIGNAYGLANASDSLRTAKVKVEIKRKDGSKRLKSIEIFKSILPYSMNTLYGKLNQQLSIKELRDSSKAVPCEIVYTYTDETTGKVFQKDVVEFTLEPDSADLKLTTDKKEKNRVSFKVESDLLPANAKFEYNIKLVSGKSIKEVKTDQNPFEYSFLEPGKYHVSVNVIQISRGLDDKGSSKRVSKELPFGSAEAFVNIEDFAKITSSNKNDEFTFKLESDITYSNVDWYLKESAQNNFTKLSQSGDEIIEKISNKGEYEIKAVLTNSLGDEVGITKTKVSLDITNQKDKIEAAAKSKDWQALYTIYTTTKSKEDKTLAGKYLAIIAKEFNDNNIFVLEKLIEKKKKNDGIYKKAYDESLVSFDKDAECIKEMNDQYINDQKEIDEVINTVKKALELYDNYYVKLNPANDITKANPQIEIFSLAEEIKDNKLLASKDPNYSGICTGQLEDTGTLNITLKPTKRIAISNEQVDLYAKYNETANVCSKKISLKWSNNAVGTGYSEGYFVATAAGRYSPTVTAYCDGKVLGSASVGITVKGGVTGNITGLAEDQIYFGTTKDIELKTDLIKAADVVDNTCNGSADNPFCVDSVHAGKRVATPPSKEVEGASVYIPDPSKEYEDEPEETGYVVRWDSNWGLEFDPQEIKGDAYSKYKTKVTFNRMENPIKIWANILQWKDGFLETVGEADVAELEVIAPAFKIEFSPTQDKAKIGQEVKVSVTSLPSVESKLIDFRWVEPTDRTDIKNGVITFTPKNGKTINIHVIARVPFYGDLIDDKIKASYTPGEYIVKAELIGPKFDKSSQEWSEKEKGLVLKNRGLVTGQAILAEASVEKYPDDVNYEWKSNDGCHIDAGNYSNEVTVSRSEPGTCNLIVTAYSKDKIKLGHDTLSFDIAEQDTGAPSTTKKVGDKENEQQKQNDNANKQKEKDQQKAAEIIKDAKQKADSGDYESAEKLVKEAEKLDPENKSIDEFKVSLKEIKQNVQASKLIDEAKKKADTGDYEGAEKILEEAKKLAPENKSAQDLKTFIGKKKLEVQASKEKLEKAKQIITSGNLKIGVAELEKAIQLDPANQEAKDLLETTKQKLQQKELTAEKIKEAFIKTAHGGLNEAELMLKEILNTDPGNREAEDHLKTVQYKKSYIQNQYEKIKVFVAKGDFNQAMAELGVCQNMSPGYALNKEIEEFIKNSKSDLINSKYLKAKELVAEGKLDEALELLKGAITLEPNNRTVVLYSNSINADKANVFKLRNSLHEALFKYKNYPLAADYMGQIEALQHPLYPPVIEAKSWFDSAQVDNPENLIKEAYKAIDEKDFKKAQQIIDKLKSYPAIHGELFAKLNKLIKKLDQQRAKEEISNKLVKALTAGDINEAKRLITIIKENQDYYEVDIEKINEIEKDIDSRIAKISSYESAKAELDRCEAAYNSGNYQQALIFCRNSVAIVPNDQVNKLIGIIQGKIAEQEKQLVQKQQSQQMSNVTKIQIVNVQSTTLKVPYPGSWNSKKTFEGDYEFTNDYVMRGLTVLNRVIPFNGATQRDSMIEQHINQMLSGSGYITKARGSRVIQGIRVHFVNLIFNEDGRTIYQTLYYPYNDNKIFEVLSSAGNPNIGKEERDVVLNSIVAAILKENSAIASNNTPQVNINSSSDKIIPWIKKLEYGTNRPGPYYSAKIPSSVDPEVCAIACEKDSKCRSFTYVEPGVVGSSAVCYYRDYVPKSIAASKYVSGVVSFVDKTSSQSSSSGSSSSTTPKTTTSSSSTSSKLAPRVVFVNKSGMPIHFYGKNESCSPNNKVNPGGNHIRALMAGYSNSSVRTFYAGRNGSTIAKVDVPTSYISQNGQKVYVIYDSSGKLYWNK